MVKFANFGGRVEPHTFSTRKFIWVPSFGEHKHLNFEKRVEPHTFSTRNFLWVPSFGEPKGDNFFHVPNLHTSARSIDSNLHAQEKGKIEALTGNYVEHTTRTTRMRQKCRKE